MSILRWSGGLLVLGVIAGVLALVLPSGPPLPQATAEIGFIPDVRVPADMAIYRLPTGITHRNAAVGYEGGSLFEMRDFTMTAVLVQHPRGDVLIDAGFGRRIDEQIRELPFLLRLLARYEVWTPVADQLAVSGYDLGRLRGILLTHAHWDHVSGAADLPGVPILLPEKERAFIDKGGMVTAIARSLPDPVYETYAFDGPPYLGFPASHDFYGDGAIVAVPAPGHTPGSTIIFVNLPTRERYAFLGDLVWQTEGVTLGRERPWYMRALVDDDRETLRQSLASVVALARAYRQITMVPAHDARAFRRIPLFRPEP